MAQGKLKQDLKQLDGRTSAGTDIRLLKPEMEGYYENYRIDVPKHVFLNVE